MKIYCAVIEVGGNIMNVAFSSESPDLNEKNNWITVDYLHSIMTDDDGNMTVKRMPENTVHTSVKLPKNKFLAFAEASPKQASFFMDIISDCISHPSDLMFENEPELPLNTMN